MPGRRAHVSTSNGSQCTRSHTSAQSHSLSQSYRADLPTSLARVIFSPEVSSLGDLMRLSVRSQSDTRSSPSGGTEPCTRRVTSPHSSCTPASGAGLFCRRFAVRQGRWSCRADPGPRSCVMRRRLRTGLQEYWPASLSPVTFALACSLGPSHPQSVLVAAESFSSSVARMRANCYFN